MRMPRTAGGGRKGNAGEIITNSGPCAMPRTVGKLTAQNADKWNQTVEVTHTEWRHKSKEDPRVAAMREFMGY